MFTTGSYPVTFEPKTILFATANPIDYTHSGKVIEPLYDRLKSHIHTHYPKTIQDEMLIILQEANISKSFIFYIILYTLAKIIHKTRESPQINQDRGVSVRLGIHGLELLVGEAQRCRTISTGISPIPRLADLYCLNQIAKFELAEMDDTIQNRHKLFDDIISESVKEICLENMIPNIEPKTLDAIRQEFDEKSFHTSQQLTWKGYNDTSDDVISYEMQLQEFPTLKKLVESHKHIMIESHNAFRSKAENLHIGGGPLDIPTEYESEILAIITEMVLEGLCWTKPKVLDKREASRYVKAI
jgi:magnesium chelatase subunit I